MDSDFMNRIAEGVARSGIEVVRFEFDYMAKTRKDGRRRGPDRLPKLIETFEEALGGIAPPAELFIGGKSMGGRVASMVAGKTQVAGVVCLGYPFHPPGKPDRLRTSHLETIGTPTLIVQGTRDPFGAREEVEAYRLAALVELAWLEDGDHSFKPRKKSGRTWEQNLEAAVRAVVEFIERRP